MKPSSPLVPGRLLQQLLAEYGVEMIPAHETFGGTWPFAPHFFEGNGFRMHYVEEGDGEPIICLHGEPTWGYLYRRFIQHLSGTNRVAVPDHMGFGKSETPLRR
jgi:cis-3-alkyl-4-acyloxetan-2-one decarboxylase